MRKSYKRDALMWRDNIITLSELRKKWKKEAHGVYSRLARALKEIHQEHE